MEGLLVCLEVQSVDKDERQPSVLLNSGPHTRKYVAAAGVVASEERDRRRTASRCAITASVYDNQMSLK